MISKIHHPGYEPLTRFSTGFRPASHIMTENYVETIGKGSFPAQDESVIGNTIYICVMRSVNGAGYKEYGNFLILRCDTEKPNVAILIGIDKMEGVILVSSTEHIKEYGSTTDDSGNKLQNPHIHPLPIQDETMIGCTCIDEYMDSEDPNENIGYIVRKDITCIDQQVVIYEPNQNRFVLQNETRVMVKVSPFEIMDIKPVMKKVIEGVIEKKCKSLKDM